MKVQNNTLKLLVIDDNQLYAERLVDLLENYFEEVELGFLDSKEELVKYIRQSWDVLVFGEAYDMKLPDVVAVIQENEVDLPVIGLSSNSDGGTRNDENLPKVVEPKFIQAIPNNNEAELIVAIVLQAHALKARRQVNTLRGIITEAEQRANVLISNSKSAVAYIDQGIHIFANQPYLDMFGYDSMDALLGVPVIDVFAKGDAVKEFKRFLKRFDKGNRDKVEFKFESKRTDGSTFEAKLQIAAATFEGTPVSQIIIQQEASGVNAAEVAKKLAEAERRDSLTGLDNRRGFEINFENAVARAHQNDETSALMYIRLDNLGQINTSLGIQGVDETIKQLGNKLNSHFSEDYVSRFSDQIFTVILHDSNENSARKQAEILLPEIANMMIEVGNRTTNTTATIGMILIEKQSPASDVILQRAVEAVNQVLTNTDNVGNGYHLYDPSQYVNEDDAALAEYLAGAFTHNRFSLVYQPVYDINTDTSELFEVYLRLVLSDGTVMRPQDFLPIAKEHNLLEKIDRWILINACKTLSQVKASHPNARILVRLTSASLSDSQLPNVASQLVNALGGDKNALTIQFDENDVVNYLAVAKKQFAALAAAGSKLSMKSFGATAKSVETLEFVKPDMVRVDQSYVKKVNESGDAEALKTLIANASEKGVDAMMPYISSAATMSSSWSVGARYLQGDYLQEPTAEMTFGEEEAG